MVIITDMNNLPHSCHDCRVNCGRFFKENGEYKRHPDCPLKEVSECEDCISRADAINAMEDKAKKLTNEDTINGLCGAVAILYELPPSTPQEPRKGHWIGQKKIGFGEWKECIVPLKDGFVTDSCSCSVCGDWLTGSDEYQCSGNFCPNCGADMREVEE